MPSDKLPALPPRPKSICADTAPASRDWRHNETVFPALPTIALWDAQDARILELSDRVEELEEAQNGWGENFEGQKQRIAELERDIREAVRLLNQKLWSPFAGKEWARQDAKDWVERNAERENGQ